MVVISKRQSFLIQMKQTRALFRAKLTEEMHFRKVPQNFVFFDFLVF